MPRRVIAALGVVVALTACGEEPGSRSASSTSATSTDTAPVVTEAARPDPLDGFTPLAPVDVRAELVATVTSAVDLAVRPGDPALYVVEHAGRVVRVDGTDVRAVADLTDRLVDHLPEQGLTGLEFATDGDVAWIHATTRAGTTTVSEVAVDPDGTFDLATERPLVEIADTPAVNHNAGDLHLDADGNLLITLGDGHADNDRFRNGGDPTTLRGSILRVQPTPSAAQPYEVPADNPFADGPLVGPDGRRAAGAPEVFAWGLRNPWKIDLDPLTGSLWIADVGEDDAEEINAVFPLDGRPAGWSVDFGWSRFEGTTPQNDDVPSALGDPVDPIFTYPHDGDVCAIAGGVVYRGAAIPELSSGYVYADFCAGSVWVHDSIAGTSRPLLGATSDQPAIGGVSAVRRGPDGEIYVLSWSGSVHRLVSSDG